MKKEIILENIVRPLVARFGTALAALLLGWGFESHTVEPVVTWLGAGLLLGVDLALARYYRRLTFASKFHRLMRGDQVVAKEVLTTKIKTSGSDA